MKMLTRSLPGRIALIASLIGAGFITLSASFFGVYQKNLLEKQLIAEARSYAERFTTWTLGYFYQQDNLLHLETQQRFLSESPNIIYSYIVRNNGLIDVGIEGVNSGEVGKAKQSWEPELPIDFTQQVALPFIADEVLASKFKVKLQAGDEVLLVGFPVSCPEQSSACAQLRVAIAPQGARNTALNFTLAFVGFGVLAAVGTGLAVFYASRQQVNPLLRLTALMRQAQETSDEAVQKVRESLRTNAEEETLELSSLRTSLQSYLDVLELSTAQGAIARSTQAFAHDVRKPFSMFKALIEAVQSTSDIVQAREIFFRAIPEINLAMKKVDVMIRDVMQMGGETKLNTAPLSVRTLVGDSLREAFGLYPERHILLNYNFSHRKKVLVDSVHMGRVILNILENAIQAMPDGDQISISTNETSEKLEICISNSGSFITEDARQRLFDLFYTANKEGGTGLGLAIVKKIVELHGGQIRCESFKNVHFPKGKVEFVFTLPISSEQDLDAAKALPFHSKEFVSIIKPAAQSSGENVYEDDSRLIEKIQERLLAGTEPPVVLAVDDEQVYLDSLLGIMASLPDVSARLNFKTLQKMSIEGLVEHLSGVRLLILDLDLGAGEVDGFELIRRTRAAGFQGLVCVHSNRLSARDNKAAVAAGADIILPKPMGRSHLIKLLAEALGAKTIKSGEVQSSSARKLRVAHIDDSEFMLYVFKSRLKGRAEVESHSSPQVWLEKLHDNPNALSQYDLVITDHYFAAGSEFTGLRLAADLRALEYSRPIVLLTDAEISEQSLRSAGISARLEKNASWEDILSAIQNST